MAKFPQYVGSCRVLLALDRDTVRWSEFVTGSCVLLGGQSDQRVHRVQARLVLSSVSGEAPQHLADSRSATWKDLSVPARGKLELPIRLRVPPRSPLGTRVQVQLTVEVPGLWGDGIFLESITIEPSEDFAYLAEVAAELTGLRPGPWRTLAGGDGLGVSLRPDRSAEVKLDGLEIMVLISKGSLHGELIVDPADAGVSGRLKGLAGLDRVRYPFRLPRGDQAEVVRQFEQLLRPYIHPNRQYPVPAQAPGVEVETLPVPAGEVGGGNRNLPRISQGDERGRD